MFNSLRKLLRPTLRQQLEDGVREALRRYADRRIAPDLRVYVSTDLVPDGMSAGAQADIYALGIIFYELLTRKLPGRRSPMPSQINASLPRVGKRNLVDRTEPPPRLSHARLVALSVASRSSSSSSLRRRAR